MVDNMLQDIGDDPLQHEAWLSGDEADSVPDQQVAEETRDPPRIPDPQGQTPTAPHAWSASATISPSPVAVMSIVVTTDGQRNLDKDKMTVGGKSMGQRLSSYLTRAPSFAASKHFDHGDDMFSVPDGSMSQSFVKAARRLSHSLSNVALGDDNDVKDRWEVMNSFKDGDASTFKMDRDNKVWPSDSHKRTSTGSYVEDIVNEKRVSRTLLWYYFQTVLYSALVAGICIPLVAGISAIQWHVDVDISTNIIPGVNTTNSMIDEVQATIRPNAKALQLMMMFQLIFPLAIYALFLYICIRKTFKIPRILIITTVVTITWSVIVSILLWRFNVSFWFYYIDLFLIVAAYVPCMCAVGWCIETKPDVTLKDRLIDMLFVAVLEILVASSTLLYCYFLMPMFFTLTSAWLQMLWLCVLHPLYFEIFTGFIVRKVLYRNRSLGRTDVVYFLTIVHAMVHTVALATSLQASIEPVRILAVTILIYNISKLLWRSTVIPRDMLIERLFHGWSFKLSDTERVDLARMVSVGVITEIILENTSIIVSPFLLYRMYDQPIFMSIVPNTFFENGGGYPITTLLSVIGMLFAFTSTFDIGFFFLNYYTSQRLPLINTWRRIKKAQLWYTLFLVYAFACMGVLFLFLTMLILPRAAYCRSDNYCDCTTLAYKTICEGKYISMLVDYLIDP